MVPQIIPTTGAHEQIMCGQDVIDTLVLFGYIAYDPEYGPFAKVYRPVEPLVNADTIRSWLT